MKPLHPDPLEDTVPMVEIAVNLWRKLKAFVSNIFKR